MGGQVGGWVEVDGNIWLWVVVVWWWCSGAWLVMGFVGVEWMWGDGVAWMDL